MRCGGGAFRYREFHRQADRRLSRRTVLEHIGAWKAAPHLEPLLAETLLPNSSASGTTSEIQLSGILRGVKLLYYQLLMSTDRCFNILRSESSGAPDF